MWSHGLLRVVGCVAVFGLLSMIVGGCGGGDAPLLPENGDGGGDDAGPVAQLGSIVVNVDWPQPPAESEAVTPEMIPAAAQCIVLTITDAFQRMVGEWKIPRFQSQLVIGGIPAGWVNIVAEAKPNLDGTGVAQAQGSAVREVAPNAATNVDFVLQSTITSWTIGPESPRFGVGWSQVFTATALNAQNQVVLVPAPGAPNWEITVVGGGDPTEYVLELGRGGDQSQYCLNLVGLRSGMIHVRALMDEDGAGPGGDRVAERDLTIEDVMQWNQDAEQYVGRHAMFDEMKLGKGFDSYTGRQKDSPFEDIDVNNDVIAQQPGDGIKRAYCLFGRDTRTTISGFALDSYGEVEYMMVAGGSQTASWDESRQRDQYACSVDIGYFIDRGEWWLRSSTLRLKRDAAHLLATDRAAFRARYGDRFVIGDKRCSFLNAKYGATHISESFARDVHLEFDVYGTIEEISGEVSASGFEWLTELSDHTGVRVDVTTNGNIDGQIAAIISEMVNPNDDARAAAIVAQLGGVAENLDSARSVQCGLVTVPMSWVIPALLSDTKLYTGPVDKWMMLYQNLLRQQERLAEIIPAFDTTYGYLSNHRKTDLQAAKVEVDGRVAQAHAVLEDWAINGTMPGNPTIGLVQLKWPDPHVDTKGGDYRQTGFVWLHQYEPGFAHASRAGMEYKFTVEDVGCPCYAVVSGLLRIPDPVDGGTRTKLDDDSWRFEWGGQVTWYANGDAAHRLCPLSDWQNSLRVKIYRESDDTEILEQSLPVSIPYTVTWN